MHGRSGEEEKEETAFEELGKIYQTDGICGDVKYKGEKIKRRNLLVKASLLNGVEIHSDNVQMVELKFLQPQIIYYITRTNKV